eukprot:scaffold5874_cov153-Skeletonema_dohrnii-CCMP3373.AAC.1
MEVVTMRTKKYKIRARPRSTEEVAQIQQRGVTARPNINRRKTNTSDFQVSISHDFGMNPKMLDLGPGLQCAFFQWHGVTGHII